MKQNRAAQSRNGTWQDVPLYDNENHFRGQAIFETEKEAHEYMKIYNDRLQTRNDLNMSNNHGSKINVQLKIFEENDKPQVDSPFYYKKRSYNI